MALNTNSVMPELSIDPSISWITSHVAELDRHPHFLRERSFGMEAEVTVVLDGRVVFRENVRVGDINVPWTREQAEREMRREAWRAVLEDGRAQDRDEPRAEYQIVWP